MRKNFRGSPAAIWSALSHASSEPPSTRTSSAPNARMTCRRSRDAFFAIVIRHRYPFTAAAIARPMPVFPLDDSTSVMPGRSSPSRSAPSIIDTAIRSFTEPHGLKLSSFARIWTPGFWKIRLMRTSGVRPTVSRMELRMSAILACAVLQRRRPQALEGPGIRAQGKLQMASQVRRAQLHHLQGPIGRLDLGQILEAHLDLTVAQPQVGDVPSGGGELETQAHPDEEPVPAQPHVHRPRHDHDLQSEIEGRDDRQHLRAAGQMALGPIPAV